MYGVSSVINGEAASAAAAAVSAWLKAKNINVSSKNVKAAIMYETINNIMKKMKKKKSILKSNMKAYM